MSTPILIRAATIVDGTGRPRYTGDLLVAGALIAQLGDHLDVPSDVPVIDADGLVAAPGFIDMHAHSDLALLTDHDHLAKVSQGVTTEVLGQDGLSYAPTTDQTLPVIRRQIAGWNGNPDDLDFSWRSVGEYLDRLDRGAACNGTYLIPHGTVRMAVLGNDDRGAGPADLARMQAFVAGGMRQGAFGMSAGLSYVPGMFADTAELVALCRTVAEYGGYFSPHQRSYGKGAIEGYTEMIDISRRSGCPLHLAHATMNFHVNKGRAGELVALIDDALVEGLDVSFDSYPYLPGSTTLSALLPSWAAVGGPDAVLQRLGDSAMRERITEDFEVNGTDGCHGVTVEWDTIEIAGVQDPELSYAIGKTIAELAVTQRATPSEIYFRILTADRLGTTILQHVGDEENVRTMMRHRVHCGSSDGLLNGAKPHPRSWGTFPRYLGHYVRDESVLSIEEAIVHLAARPARRLGLTDRGLLREGNVADLVLFDPDAVTDRATFDNPRQQAAGIPWVFVAGQPVIARGERTELAPGRALRHRGKPAAG